MLPKGSLPCGGSPKSRLSIIIYGMHTDPRVLLGRRVRELRAKRGISQEELADIAHVHRAYMGAVERGEKNIGLLNVVRIARALRVAPMQLLAKIK